jgi:hypothetical protein
MFGIDKKQLETAMKELEPVKEFIASKLSETMNIGGQRAVMSGVMLRGTVEERAGLAFNTLYPDKNQRIDVANELRKIVPNLWDVMEVEDVEFRKALFEAFKADDPLAATVEACEEPIGLLFEEIISILRKHCDNEVGDKAEVAMVCFFRSIYGHLPQLMGLWECEDWNGIIATFRDMEVELLCALGEAFTPIAKAS